MADELATARADIDTSRYTGYLRPWIDIIVNLHFGGLSPAEIAHEIGPLMRAKYKYGSDGPADDPSCATIKYLLRRIGAAAHVEKARPNGNDRSLYVAALRDQGFTLAEIGQRVGCTKEYVRRTLLKCQEAESRRGRIERMDRIIDEWLAEQDVNEHRQRTSKGRPLDMGGPRDVWIETDPWSDL